MQHSKQIQLFIGKLASHGHTDTFAPLHKENEELPFKS